MNLIVIDDKFQIDTRPDSTLCRESGVYYIPDFIETLFAQPVYYIKTDRAGKAIQARFAHRYYSKWGYGTLLYGVPSPFKEYPKISYLDHTTIISPDLYTFEDSPESISSEVTILNAEDNIILTTSDISGISSDRISLYIEYISARISLKTGDLIILPITEPVEIGDSYTLKVPSVTCQCSGRESYL